MFDLDNWYRVGWVDYVFGNYLEAWRDESSTLPSKCEDNYISCKDQTIYYHYAQKKITISSEDIIILLYTYVTISIKYRMPKDDKISDLTIQTSIKQKSLGQGKTTTKVKKFWRLMHPLILHLPNKVNWVGKNNSHFLG